MAQEFDLSLVTATVIASPPQDWGGDQRPDDGARLGLPSWPRLSPRASPVAAGRSCRSQEIEIVLN